MAIIGNNKKKPDNQANKPKTDVFVWEGKNKKGEKAAGEIEATSLILAKAALRKQGITFKKVKKRGRGIKTGKPIKSMDICIFSRQMSTMMSAGIPLVQSFDIVGKGQTNPNMQNLIMQIKVDVEAGNTLAEALQKHPKYFPSLFCNLIGAGEQSGALETMLDRVATYQEKSENVKAKIKKAMTYPAAVLGVSFLVTAVLLVFVVPQFETMFKNFGADLPAPTQFVVNASKFMQAYWWVVVAQFAGAGFGFVQLKRRSKAFNKWWDRAILKAPVVGPILENAIIARFTRTLSVTFAAGLPLVDALRSVAGATGNSIFYEATMKILDDVSSGQQLQFAMRNSGLFPNMVLQMVAIGEESGALEKMLSKVADFYETAVDDAVDNLSALIEPFILVFLALIVGGLMISMYLPIFKMGSAV